MQSRLNYIRRAIPLLALVLGAAAAWPQSHNREAMKWFDAGLAEKTAAKKIEAYAKAVESDPNFAEALFNLGAAYKEQKNYDRAEQYFRRAANAAQTDLRVKALSEMASIHNIRGNSKSYESALREAKTLATDSKQRALLSYELGRFLYQQGRYEQAVGELKDGRAGDSGQRESFDNLLKLAENSSQLDYLYATAEKQKAGGNLKEAKTTLEQIKAKNASFRNVQARLAEVETLLAAESGKTADAATANNVNTNVNTNDVEAEAAYAEGLVAIRKRDWAGAIAAFERVLQINPEYRDARQKLAGAQMYFERDNVEVIAARYYDEGVAAMNRNDLDSALVLLGKVLKINRRYRDAASLYAQVEASRRLNLASTPPALPIAESAMEAPDSSVAANLSATPPFVDSTRAARPFAANTELELDSLYQIASAAYGRGDWNEAVLGFQKIRVLQSNYRDVDHLFATARTRLLETSLIAEAVAAINRSRPSPLMMAGLAAAAVGFFVCGFIFLSPTARARYQSRRGNHEAAMLIYESLLARHPSRLKLYPGLAEIYLKLDRRDEEAMKVYRRVLDLNLPSQHRADLSEIAALNTFEEKPVDAEVAAKTEALTPEPVAATNGVLLADDGFQAPEKTPIRRPRKKKETGAPLNGAASVPVVEEAAAEIPVSEEPPVKAPARPRQSRKKKEAPREAGVENGTVTDHSAENGVLQAPPEPSPAKKARRKKVTVVEAVSINGTLPHPAEENVAALATNLRVDSVELVVPAENETPQDGIVAQHLS